jgi:hypothetical protein
MPHAKSVVRGEWATQWGAVPLPQPLAPLMPGRTLQASGEIVFPVANPAGRATVTVTIPSVSALAGLGYYNQALVADPGVNPAELLVSGAGEAVIGEK